MAESIYTQLANQTVLTPVDGVEYRHPLPEGLFPDDKTFESPEKLIAWAKEHGHTAKLLQKGLQKGVIEVRAAFKACKKTETWSEELGLANIAAMTWDTVDRPNQGGQKKLDQARYNDCLAMIGKLSTAGMDTDTIKDMTVAIYGEDMVNSIIETLQAA